jgi:hypothetical protein
LNAREYMSGGFRTYYSNEYDRIFADVASGRLGERDVLRSLFANDLWFFLMYGMGVSVANQPFVVDACRMVETGPDTDTLDVWAREHFKTTISVGANFQRRLKDPEGCTAFFAYARPAAKPRLRSVKLLCEQSDLLKWCFSDVLWSNPESEAPKWSEDDGIIFKRKSTARRESTFEAWGLVEGMPVGRHFEDLDFDDIETDDIRESPDMLNKVYSKIEMAENLGVRGGRQRFWGTYYSHFGPMVKLRDKQKISGEPMYKLRLKPATHDGTISGKPVLFSQEELDKRKAGQFFNSQQLCNPTPAHDIKLDFTALKPIEPQFVPRNIYKFFVLDQAGGDETDKISKDLWSFGVLGVEPCINDIGQSKVYLLDLEADRMSHSEGIDGVVRMYCRNGMIQQMGVEKVGLSTTEIHIANALRAHGRRISLDGGNLKHLKPAGRSKEFRVESALQWPLNNGMLYYSTAIPKRYIEAIREEMLKFPFFHVDILDMWAYVYDLIKEFRFVDYRDNGREDDVPREDYQGQSAVTGY